MMVGVNLEQVFAKVKIATNIWPLTMATAIGMAMVVGTTRVRPLSPLQTPGQLQLFPEACFDFAMLGLFCLSQMKAIIPSISSASQGEKVN
jgi:hypothetical protein